MILRLENLTKQFGDLVAVKDLNLTIEEGEIISLLGPSGCGKTTTLNMIAGFERATAGKVYFDDRCVNDVHPKERNVGMVFQEYAIFTTMTVFQNISFGLRVRKVPKAEIRAEVRRIAENLNLEKILDRNVANLNLSELQRVALARTISVKPSVLLLDEPLSNLDAALRERTRVELKRFHNKWGITMIYVTHDQLEAISLAKRIAVMDSGMLQQFGTADEIYRHPANLFVAKFIGNPPSNVVRGEVVKKDRSYMFKSGEYELDISMHGDLIKKALKGNKLAISFHTEDVKITRSRNQKNSTPVEVFVVELLGYDQIIDLKVDDLIIRALVPSSMEVKVDERLFMDIPVDKINLFDLETEKNIFLTAG